MASAVRVAGLVLAGGLGSRLGGGVPKPLVDIGGTTSLAVAVDRLSGVCDPLFISANDPPAYGSFGLPILADLRAERLGPLAALEAAHRALSRSAGPATHLICLPGDTPFLPVDIADRLVAGAEALVRIAAFGDRLHPTVSIWPLEALPAVVLELDRPGSKRSLMGILDRIGFETVPFGADESAPDEDPFFNVNTPDDLARARHRRLSMGDRLGKAAS